MATVEAAEGSANTRSVWLLQFRDGEHVARWRKEPTVGQPARWLLPPSFKTLRAKDIVLFWQSDPGGGLKGLGEVLARPLPQNSATTLDAAVIIDRVWLSSPVSAVDGISPNNLLRLNRGAYFRLSTTEAQSLLARLNTAYRQNADQIAKSKEIREQFKREFTNNFSDRARTAIDVAGAAPFVFEVDLKQDFDLVSYFYITLAEVVFLQINIFRFNVDSAVRDKLFANFSGQYKHSMAISASSIIPNFSKTFADTLRSSSSYRPRPEVTVEYIDRIAGSDTYFTQLFLYSFISALDAIRNAIAPNIDLIDRMLQEDTLASFAPSDPLLIDVAGVTNDDPWRRDLADRLGVLNEARAFARIAVARDFDPPLAFGVFGNWGSGKTFFLRLVHQHVNALAQKSAPEFSDDRFHSNIVQIRFNAWHYAETNLWASLVEKIFSDLASWIRERASAPQKADQLFERLATARELNLEAAERFVRRRQDQRDAAERLAAAERKRNLVAVHPGARTRAFWDAVRRTFFDSLGEGKDELSEAANALGLEQIATDVELLKGTIDDLRDDRRRAKIVAAGLFQQLQSWTTVALIVAAVILIPMAVTIIQAFLVKHLSDEDVRSVIQSINGITVTVAGVIASIATILKVARAHVSSAISKLEKTRSELEESIQRQLKEPTQEVQSAEKALAELNADVDEARRQLATTNELLAEAARDYADGSRRGRLLRFVRDRASDGEYAKHLGLVATIRRDFDELTSLMSEADESMERNESEHAAYAARVAALIESSGELLSDEQRRSLRSSEQKASVEPMATFKRIILYIDDLDRVAPDKVVDVLQAVHLLLTFPLFVVFVAVDARWLSRALERHYPQLIDPVVGADFEQRAATAHDYLEKIFQVPYWVRPMSAAASQDLLADRLDRSELVTPVVSQPAATVRASSIEAVKSTSDRPAVEEAAGSEKFIDSPSSSIAPTQDFERDDLTIFEVPRVSEPAEARALQITDAERQFMKILACSVGDTPRRALRFLNVYRVAKASLDGRELERLGKEGGYRALMTQVAIATGAPTLLKSWVAMLDANETLQLSAIQERLQKESWFLTSAERASFSKALAIFFDECKREELEHTDGQVFANAITLLRHYGPVARRYSFTG